MTDLSRRKMLAALGGTGIAAFTGFVYTTDDSIRYTQASSHSCEDYTLNAEWRETYTSDGGMSILEDTTSDKGTETDNPESIRIENILPGDRGTVSFRLGAERTNDSASPTVTPTLDLRIDERAENEISDAEGEAGDTTDTEGELQDYLDIKTWHNNGFLGIDSLGANDLDQDLGEDTIEEGTLEEVANNLNGRELGQLDATSDDTTSVTLRWTFADSGGINVTQTDSVTFILDVDCTQQ